MNLVDKLRTKRAAILNRSGLGKILAPGVVIAALVVAGIFVINNGNRVVDETKEKATESTKSTFVDPMEKTAATSDSAPNAKTAMRGRTRLNLWLDWNMDARIK